MQSLRTRLRRDYQRQQAELSRLAESIRVREETLPLPPPVRSVFPPRTPPEPPTPAG
jgi:hypothetical protein